MTTKIDASEISDLIKARIEKYDLHEEMRTEGRITSLKDGIVRIAGLENVMQGEMIAFPGDVYGMALNLENTSVGAVVLGSSDHLEEGMTVQCTGRILEVPVGEALIGRVVDALGRPIDGKGDIETDTFDAIEKQLLVLFGDNR